ncbi:site-specific integrase [Pseudomonas sp. BN414]|uniref:tyrosine-type recombinase/integrase n=1 Tax=Pseudomonas TaxID=286 RepID=UPI0015C0C69C|nr:MULTISPECIES: site-specific integrase [Pseudomonas]MDH4565637.1 site-specific integrase [Pseudomonas sp. BN414]NWL76061.1 site-specific integrase [Pseudomonas taiwanensis]
MTTPTRDQLKAALEEIRSELGYHEEESEPITDEEDDETLSDDSSFGIICNNSNTLNLSKIDKNEWSYIRVSPRSSFGDPVWDFRDYPSPYGLSVRINLDYVNMYGVNVCAAGHEHWAYIARALLFYRVPHFAIHGRLNAYSSLEGVKIKILRLVGLFHAEGLYLGSENSPDFRTVSDLAKSSVHYYIESLPTTGIKWEFCYIMSFWQDLSSLGMLPPEYSLYDSYVTKELVAKYRREYDESSRPFEPIPLDDYAGIFKYCVGFVENYSDDVLWLYKNFAPTIAGAFENPEKLAMLSFGVSTASAEGIERFMAYKPKLLDNGTPWWGIEIMKRKYEDNEGQFLNHATVISIVVALIDACIVLLLCLTGMRRSEVVGLKVDCLSFKADGYWLTYTVFKTSISSQGDIKTIPIPKIAADAIDVIVELGRDARAYGKHDYLFAKIPMSSFGNVPHSSGVERACNRVAGTLGIDYKVHPHRYRKSLALYIIHQDSRNLEIIKRLFSHRSLKMTLRYILSLPGVNDEVKATLIEENTEILVEVLQGVISGQIGGIGGKRLAKTANSSPILRAKLQNAGKESLSQYVASLLDEGVKLLHRTNLAICLRTPGLTSESPCDAKNDSPGSRLHPNLFACDPYNCRHAAFVEANVPSLKNEIIFHDNMIKHRYCGATQKEYSQRRIAEAFKRLHEVVGDEAHNFLKQVANG